MRKTVAVLASLAIAMNFAWADGYTPAYVNLPQLFIADFGAKFDAIARSDGAITVNSSTFTSPTGTFSAKDCQHGRTGCTGAGIKTIDIDFAGPGCGPLHTSIVSVVSSHIVTLADTASCTTGYQYAWAWDITTPQAGSGSYAPGDGLTLSGGTATVAATATVTSTQVADATIVSGGTGGKAADGTDTGTCDVQATTGAGAMKAVISVTLAGGVMTAINSVFMPGVYTTNPTNINNEPVRSVINCSGLAGAALSLKMGVLSATPGTHAHGGQYSVAPTSPAATTSTGAGTGATITPIWYRAGGYIYGSDDTRAWTAAFTKSSALSLAGKHNCLILPGGISLVTSQLPMWTRGPCIHGQSRDKSLLYLSSVFSGNAIWIDNAWIELVQNAPKDGSMTPIAENRYGTDLADFAIFGTRGSPNLQRGLIFSDSNDFVTVRGMHMRSLNGSCFGMGHILNSDRAFTRESNFRDILVESCGAAGEDSFYVDAEGRGTTNDNYYSNINVYAPYGTGVHLSADGTARVAHNQFDRLRVEGVEFLPELIDGDLLVIGDAVKTGVVRENTFDKVHLVDPYLNHYALRYDADAANHSPFDNRLSGTIGGGIALGGGLYMRYGRNNENHFSSMQSLGVDVTFGTGAGVWNAVTGTACQERDWTYQIAGNGSPVSNLCYVSAVAADTPPAHISSGADSGTLSSGNPTGSGSVNLSVVRGNPSQVPAGPRSASIASSSSSSTGSNSVDVGDTFARLTGSFTQALGSYAPSDHGWATSRILSGFSSVAGFGGNQIQETVLGCKTAATNAATCTLTSDGTGTPSTTNVANPADNTSYATSLICNAHDSTNNTNARAWVGVPALLLRGIGAGSVVGSFGAIPTPLTIGAATGAALTTGADTTNGGAALTFAAPTTNSAVWVITCYAPTIQTD